MESSESVSAIKPPTSTHKKRRNRRKNNRPTLENGAMDSTVDDPINSIDLTQLTDMSLKTPVSILQEILGRQGVAPKYELVRVEGTNHEPTFRYRVWYNDKDAIGAGKSKKQAKHSAAKALIDKLTGVALHENEVSNTSNGTTDSSDLNTVDNRFVGNPIGWLQELCIGRRWPPPFYENEPDLGQPHDRQFTIVCAISKYREVGQGKSKKIAKRMAAHKMWMNIHKNPLVSDGADPEVETASFTTLNCYTNLKSASMPISNNQHLAKVAEFHESLKNVGGKALDKLKIFPTDNDQANYLQLLEEIATEHQFEIKYNHIEEKTMTGRFQCLVQLTTLPLAVCQGTGTTAEDAQCNAAQNALEYMRIMTGL